MIMYINLRIGSRAISITAPYKEYEEDSSWGEVLDELVWPALRAYGYIIDHEFTDGLQEEHRQYVADKRR